jgi:hypothetical protein
LKKLTGFPGEKSTLRAAETKVKKFDAEVFKILSAGREIKLLVLL